MGDVLGLQEDLRVQVGTGLGDHLCIDSPGKNRGNPNSMLLSLHSQRLGQTHHRVLAGGVGRLVRITLETDHAGNIDDVPLPFRDHESHRLLTAKKHRLCVDQHHPVEIRRGKLRKRPKDTNYGIVHQDIESSRPIADSLKQEPNILFI